MDLYLFQKINGLAGNWPFLDALGIFFAKYFEYILVASVILMFGKKWKIIFQAFLAAGIARLAIVNIIRWIVRRPRPFVENHVNLLLDKTVESSFPSGHAAFYFAIATVVFLYYKKVYPRPKFWWGAGIAFFAASFLISLSRVFSGIHWPSDILAGAIVGIFSGFAIDFLSKRYYNKLLNF